MKLRDLKYYYNYKPVEFVLKGKLFEDSEYIPRFSLKNAPKIKNLPINKPVKPTIDIIKTAIEYGLIFNITYKGALDKSMKGHSRVIYPMVIGESEKGDILIRGYHLVGWSVSSEGSLEKDWRMFRLDRMISITFTGSFYRLPPNGYNANDKSMDKIIKSADFTSIRRKQQELISSNDIEPKEKSQITNDTGYTKIKVEDVDSILDLDNIKENPFLMGLEDISGSRITFLKSVFGSEYIVIIGAGGKPGNHTRIVDIKNNNIGTFKVLDTINGEALNNIKKVNSSNKIYKIYLFKEKIS